jgi:hypothetical protein
VLREELPKPTRSADGVASLSALLQKNNLTPDEVLEQLSHQLMTAETPATRLRAAEIALKLNGLLDSDNTKPDFIVNITIMDSEFSQINPILIPR